MYSLAQAFVQPECIPLALYAENKPVGFVMYALDEDDHEYWIYRLMIDKALSSAAAMAARPCACSIERIRADRGAPR